MKNIFTTILACAVIFIQAGISQAGQRERELGEAAGRYLGAASQLELLQSGYCKSYIDKSNFKAEAYRKVSASIPANVKRDLDKAYKSGTFDSAALDYKSLFSRTKKERIGYVCGLLGGTFVFLLAYGEDNWTCVVEQNSDEYCRSTKQGIESLERLVSSKILNMK